MMKTTTKRWLAAVFLACAAAGCGDSDDEASPPSIAAQVEEALAPYEAALDHPDGTVNAENARVVLLNAGSQAAIGPMAAFVPGASTPASQPQGGDPSACISAGPSGGEIDLACISDGAMSGIERYQVEQEGSGHVVLLIDLIDACAEAVCIDGQLAMDVTSDAASQQYAVVAGGDFDITADGKVYHFEYGYRVVSSGGDVTVEAAYFDDQGHSYALDATTVGDSGTVTITGSNGSYTCSYTEGGQHGQCQPTAGGEGFTW
jgi:hypothetical protein